MSQMTLPVGEDYCTIAWAAEHLGVSPRTVGRAVAAGALKAVTPRCGSRETKRHKRMLLTAQVQEFGRAKQVITGG